MKYVRIFVRFFAAGFVMAATIVGVYAVTLLAVRQINIMIGLTPGIWFLLDTLGIACCVTWLYAWKLAPKLFCKIAGV